jgi:hypothetical protein
MLTDNYFNQIIIHLFIREMVLYKENNSVIFKPVYEFI